jgi:hypothetical protein
MNELLKSYPLGFFVGMNNIKRGLPLIILDALNGFRPAFDQALKMSS